MREWKECKLVSLTTKIGSGATPRGGSNAYKESGISLIRSQNINDFSFSTSGLAFIDDNQAEELNNVTVEEKDVLLNITGDSVARCCIVPRQILPARVNQHVSIVRSDPSEVDYRFIFYYLISIKEELLSHSEIGATRRALTKGMIESIQINLPPLPEQRAIASVLSSLDDKIDLLHRQNKTLESMAETLFRQWFIEAAPQEGWEEKPLTSIAEFLNGIACQKYPPMNKVDKLPVLKIKELRNGISDDCDWATSNISPEYIVKNGDVIFSWSASLMVKIWDGSECILNQHLFKVTSVKYPQWLYYLWCKHYLEEFITISLSHATTMGHIKRNDLENAMVSVPDNEILAKMSGIISPLIDKIIGNNKQMKSLVDIRDSLLPKLMSGEVRVKV
ncbi:restriction endonuclease subunit S [bacterium]|nr:restriction endonuclease subunit S [bacterium]